MHRKSKLMETMLISILLLSGCTKENPAILNIDNANKEAPKIITEIDYLKQPTSNWAAYREMVDVKGIYMTGNTLGWKKRFHELVDLVDRTELNAVIIDIKDDFGELTYESNIPMVKEVEADKTVKDKDFIGSMKLLANKDIYPIARIVSFKDRTAASKRPDLAVKSKEGTVWRDNKGDAWPQANVFHDVLCLEQRERNGYNNEKSFKSRKEDCVDGTDCCHDAKRDDFSVCWIARGGYRADC